MSRMTSVTLPSMTIPRRLLLVPMVLLALSGCSIFKGDGEPETPTSRNRTPILSRIATEIVADPQLASTAVVLPPAQPNTAWAQAGAAWLTIRESGRRVQTPPPPSESRRKAAETRRCRM